VAGLILMTQKVGFFGGTFDPPHCGHALLAKHACEQAELDELLWVLTPRSPFKKEQFSSLEQRIHMVELMAAHQKKSVLSTVDINRAPPYYTLETAKLIRKQLSDGDSLFFVMGGDSLRTFPKWYGASELVNDVLTGIIVARRPDDRLEASNLQQELPGLKEKLFFIEMQSLNIASREIRTKIQQGLSVQGEMLPEVVSYIQSNNIYQNPSASKESE
jgi:nicotinate-nucleotide adenylyltransferase